MPSLEPRLLRRATLLCALLLAALPAAAQDPRPIPRPPADTLRSQADSARRDSAAVRADSAARAAGPRRTRAAAAPRPEIQPPISARRAFLYSFAVPGLGQSRLQRSGAGALFVAVEATALVMARKSWGDLREAKAFRGDSLVPSLYPVDSTVTPQRPTAAQLPNIFNAALVRSRRLHLEDWLAVIAFNHLFAGAEAYVSANLWDLPTEVSAWPTDRGTVVALTIAW